MKTEKKLNFGSSGSRGLHHGTFNDGFGDFSTMKKKLKSDDGKLLKLHFNKILLDKFLEEKMSIKPTILLRSRLRWIENWRETPRLWSYDQSIYANISQLWGKKGKETGYHA